MQESTLENLTSPQGRLFSSRYWPDLRNLWIIALGMFAVLLIISPAHEYPVIDDWIYARSVQHQIATNNFVMPDRSQASLLGLTLWGTLWARVFGFSFTVLTVSTIVLAFVCLVSIYLLARLLGVGPSGSLLAAALLGFNPLFLHLSYSFMTDVPFLAFALLACLFYVLGLQGRGDIYLWLGGLAAGYSYLIRQFGILLPIGFLGYLLIDGFITRRWRWRQMLQIAAGAAIFTVGCFIYSRGFPENNSAAEEANRLASEFVGKPQWLGVFLSRALVMAPLVALFAWTAVHLSRRRTVLSAAWAVLLTGATLAITIPRDSYTFATYGNIIRLGGIDFFEYKQQPLWSPEVWKALALLGALLAGVLLGAMTDSLITWFGSLRKSQPQPSVLGIYLVGAGIFAVSLGLLGHFFDRYVLTLLPFVILFAVRDAQNWKRPGWAYSLVALALVAAFSLLAQADFIDHDNARWEAAKWLSSRAPLPIHGGYDWDNWTTPPSGQYEITDIENPGWRTEQTVPYISRLSGFETRKVFAQSALGAQPLSVPASTP